MANMYSDEMLHAFVVRVFCDRLQAVKLSDFLNERLDFEQSALAIFETKPSKVSWCSSDWTLEVYFQNQPDVQQMRRWVAEAIGEEFSGQVDFDHIIQKDWVSRSLAGLEAVRAGRFIVHGSHERRKVRKNDFGIEIEAALAFGTGHHGTTRGCLLLLDRILKYSKPRHVADIGTGTGVLAIAAARFLRQKIAAGDMDEISVTVATKNARFNGVASLVHPVVAKGFAHPALARNGYYDLIFANILAKPLRNLAPSVGAAAARNSSLILSGLLSGDVNGVLDAYRAEGFYLSYRLDLDGWVSLLLARIAKPHSSINW